MSDFQKPQNPYAETSPLVAPVPQQTSGAPVMYYAPPPSYDQSMPAMQAPVPQYAYGQPVYQQGYQQGYQQPGGYAVVITDQHHAHPVMKEDNFCFGCIMGWLFGLFGLICLMCVRDHRSYIRGWIIPFIITLVIGITLMILILTGVIVGNN